MPDRTLNRLIVAAFDFDGTITRHDTLWRCLYAASGALSHFALTLGKVAFFLPYLWTSPEGRHIFKTHTARAFFKGLLEKDVRVKAERFFESHPHLFFPKAIQKLEWHLEQGHTVFIVSANFEPFLKAWGKRYPQVQIISTRLECVEGVYTGKLIGYNCWGEEKWKRLQAAIETSEVAKPLDKPFLYAYGDSKGDLAMLGQADYAYYRPFR